MSKQYNEFIRLLVEANDESKTETEHAIAKARLAGFKSSVELLTGENLNGDYYYIEKFESGEIAERPICCGEFLDWHSSNRG